MAWFNDYTEKFERAVDLGVVQGMLGKVKAVPVHPGKLAKKKIGQVLGEQIEVGNVVVIDYYGYMKKSYGFKLMVKEVVTTLDGKQLKTVEQHTPGGAGEDCSWAGSGVCGIQEGDSGCTRIQPQL